MNFVDAVAADRARRISEHESIQLQSIPVIEDVLKATAGKPEVEILLSLGAACPFTLQWEKQIWLAEIARRRGAPR
ncbi:MAG TPA: hypothetical protein VKT12_04625 [Candidatus Binataceae bacterium]|nr:hypothetical protein [Candidatus Binataceae bacterium]